MTANAALSAGISACVIAAMLAAAGPRLDTTRFGRGCRGAALSLAVIGAAMILAAAKWAVQS